MRVIVRMTDMINAPKAESLNIEALNSSADVRNNSKEVRTDFDSTPYTKFCEQLKHREHKWWQARQRLVKLKERQMFWFGENSLMMWLLWQLVSYVVVAIVLMLLSNTLNTPLYFWHYMAVFGIQTLLFIMMFVYKGWLGNYLQKSIDNADLVREQALNEMYILASDSILPDIHANAPISLQAIHKRYESQLKLASLQRLLQKEVDAGRLLLDQYQIEAEILPPEFADDELTPYANEMIYRSLVAYS